MMYKILQKRKEKLALINIILDPNILSLYASVFLCQLYEVRNVHFAENLTRSIV